MTLRTFRNTLVAGVLLVSLSAVLSAQVIITPTDALAFDYDNQAFADYQVTRFEIQWDTQPFQLLTAQSFVAPDTPPGHTSYKFVPPFSTGNHTALVRACNAGGCGPASDPFAFGYASVSAPLAKPVNMRKVPR